jgi:hypothetical protein
MKDTIQTPIGTISVGVTVLEGERMYGDRMSGIVRKIIPGVGFVIDNGVLFRSFAVAAATSTAAEEQAIQMQELRCGFDPLPVGYPDCDFWSAVDGVDALYVATEYDYGKADTPPSPTELLTFLNRACLDALRVGGETLTAWNRQRDFVKGMHLGPNLVAGRSLGYVAHSALNPGFAQPDPVMTRQETRCYLVEEFKRYMEGRIQEEAVRLAAVPDMVDDATIDLGSFPAGRLYRLVGRLGSAVPAVALDEQIRYVVRWVVGVVTCHLADPDAIITSLESDALAFWKVDRLVDGKTIDSFWNHSPFEALRAAPPLSPGIEDDLLLAQTGTAEEEDRLPTGIDEETETEDEDEEEEEEDEEDEDEDEEEEDRLPTGIAEEDDEAEGLEYAAIAYTQTSLPIWIPMVLSVIITLALAILCSKR